MRRPPVPLFTMMNATTNYKKQQRRDGEVDAREAVEPSCQAPEESSFLEEPEESYDIGCMPSGLLDEAVTHDKGSTCQPGSRSSTEHPEGSVDGEASVVPATVGVETAGPSAALAVADASAEEESDDDDMDRPTDEQLLEGIRAIAAGGEDFELVTPKQVPEGYSVVVSAVQSVLFSVLVPVRYLTGSADVLFPSPLLIDLVSPLRQCESSCAEELGKRTAVAIICMRTCFQWAQSGGCTGTQVC